MDLLTNTKFAITVSYGIFSIILYGVVTVVICVNNKQFTGSFFKIFCAGFFMNLWTYGNSFITLRLPQNTNKNGTLGPFFTSLGQSNTDRSFPLTFFHMMHYHFAYTQYIFSFVTCFNRATTIFFPLKSERVWNRYVYLVIATMYLSPFLATYKIAFAFSYYDYDQASSGFLTVSTHSRAAIYSLLMPTLITITIGNFAMNTAAVYQMICMKKFGTRVLEKNLFLMSFCVFLIDLFLSILSIFNYFVTFNISSNGSMLFMSKETLVKINNFVQLLTPFASDCLTLSPPWLIIIFSKSIRHKILVTFHIKELTSIRADARELVDRQSTDRRGISKPRATTTVTRF